MTRHAYERLIIESIKELPTEALAEVADFAYFVRTRSLNPRAFEEEVEAALLKADLDEMGRNEEAHLDQEFADYDKLYPRE